MDEFLVEGFNANGQNEPREANPYLDKARGWDLGWTRRERERLIHILERDKADALPDFATFVASLDDSAS